MKEPLNYKHSFNILSRIQLIKQPEQKGMIIFMDVHRQKWPNHMLIPQSE